MFADALVGWLVAFLGDRLVKGVKRGLLGSPEQRALTMAISIAMETPLPNVPERSHEALTMALRERFAEPPAFMLDGHTRVRTGLIRAIQAQLAPLADPSMTPAGKSFLEEIGVDAAQIRDEVVDVVIRSIEQVGPAFPALAPLLAQLNADAIIERVDAVIETLGAQRESNGHIVTQQRRLSGAANRGLDTDDLAADWIERLTDAFLQVPAIADDDSRQSVFDLLPDRFRHAIPRSRSPRIQVLQMVRTSTNYSGALRAMVRAIRIVEGDSEPMQRLDSLILSLNAPGVDNAAPYGPGGPNG